MYEVSYAVVIFGFLCLLTCQSYYQSRWQTLLYFSILLTCLFAYPLLAYGCVVLLLYHIVAAQKRSYRLVLIYLLAFAVWFFIKSVFISDYEKGKINIPVTEYPDILRKIITPAFIISALKFLLQHYKEPVIAATIFLILMLKQKRFKLFVLTLLSISIFVGLVNFGYRGDGLIHSNNFERMYLLLVPLCFAPFFYVTYPGMSQSLKVFCILSVGVVGAYKSLGQWQHSIYYTSRLRSINDLASGCIKQGCDKGTVDWDHLPRELDEWSTGMEALIYSSETGRSCIISDKGMVSIFQSQGQLDPDHFVLRLNEVMNINELNPHYFRLSRSPYCPVRDH
jgi:hypothetical protein